MLAVPRKDPDVLRPIGVTAVRLIGAVLWQVRYDLLAVAVVAGAMAALSSVVPLQGLAAVVPLLGVVVSIFIGFRNSSAFSRWWEARTLWGTVVGNCQAISSWPPNCAGYRSPRRCGN